MPTCNAALSARFALSVEPTGSTATTSTTVRFADTNVLLYAISRDEEESAKAAIANGLLEAGDFALSTQVLQEFYVQATRASRSDRISHQQAADLVEAFTRFPVQDTTVTLVRAAVDTHGRYGMSYWDAALIEAARARGCSDVLSEDLSDGQDYAGVKVVNPFR